MKTLNEKKGYARAIAIMEKDHELRKSINPQDPCLMGMLLSLNLLRLYQEQTYPGEEKGRGQR